MFRLKTIIVCFVWIEFSFALAEYVSHGPEQVHISYGAGPNQMYVTWLTHEQPPGQPLVEYGIQSRKYDMRKFGNMTKFHTSYSRYVYRVQLEDLKLNTTYYYRCGFEQEFSNEFSFRTRPLDQEHWNPRIAVFGDMGLKNGQSFPFLKQQASKNAYDAIFHVGDIAYDMHDDSGSYGDKFMNEIEPIAANIPYQVVVGNHEDDKYNYTDYNSRFTMIDESSGKMNNMFYSFNIGPAHVIGFSSEFYYSTQYGMKQIQNQFEWLEQDLREANRHEIRSERPWIIAMAHRPMYCSTADDDDCTENESILRKGIPIVNQYGLEDLFYKYGVDIIFGAHEHTYERLFPVYDRKVYNGSVDDAYNQPKAPVHILVGSAGCPEKIDPFITYPKPWSAKRISNYGITEMLILNKTLIRFRQRDTTMNGAMVDAFHIIKGRWN
ncbi:Acid phosphatase type 7 [Dermatophagoides pteronyssinus]|uniref:Purple acid phosphatase n=1 Tax=Dermatophagoides pteronyssinus TaxID=6956 RepID=A0ABQ8JVQ9_DERPT|nr:Acid phosphatase type 7 [Dermatophagoides pteronyssinus]